MSTDKKKTIYSRGWSYTINNYTEDDIQRVKNLELVARYGISEREVGKEQETPHIQGYVYFTHKTTDKRMHDLLPRACCQPAKANDQANAIYCIKDNCNIETFGKAPMHDEDKGEAGKRKIQERWELAKAGRFEELPPEQIRVYEYIHRKSFKPIDRPTLLGGWIYGDAGLGKSSDIRKHFGKDKVFLKHANQGKWWDGYEGEEIVVIEDIDPDSHKGMIGYLKQWADHMPFIAEVKNGAFKCRPKVIFVTSNHRIDEFTKDAKTINAINRRLEPMDYLKPDLEALFKRIDDDLASDKWADWNTQTDTSTTTTTTTRGLGNNILDPSLVVSTETPSCFLADDY